MYDLGLDIPFAVLWFRRGRSIEGALYIIESSKPRSRISSWLSPIETLVLRARLFCFQGIILQALSPWLMIDDEIRG